MDREHARQFIVSHAKDYLKPDKSGSGYVCPICGSGSGSKGTGITTKDGIHFSCWAGCFTNADLIDIIGQKNGITDYTGKLQAAASELGITIDGSSDQYQNKPKNKRYTQSSIHNSSYTTTQTEEEPDYTDFFLEAAKNIGKTSYHRGLSPETLSRFHVGYVEKWRHPKSPKMELSPRLIVPTSKHSYLARHASEKDFINFRGQVENKSKVGHARIFNIEALKNSSSPIFVCEGEIDAMSYYEIGAEAIGLGSLSNVKLLLEHLENERPSQNLIIALDNEKNPDTAKRVAEALKTLEAEMKRLGIPFYAIPVTLPYKDANEALMADRTAFAEAVAQAIDLVEEVERTEREIEREILKKESVANAIDGFLQSIEDSKTAPFYSTGFSSLDALLGGGLFTGLYFVGAVSSLGKTTLCLNIADNVAREGNDVLFFSLEMGRHELIAKSVSRLTFIKDEIENNTSANAKTTRGILTGARYDYYSERELALIREAVSDYRKYADRIYISEGYGDIGVAQIREKVSDHIRITGRRPLTIIDYVQILSPHDVRATDKQNTDRAVVELKRLSRDYGIPIIGISSFNRDNYLAPVNMASFKESGGLEYSADCLIGLQYEGMDYEEGESDKAREKRIRELMKQAIEDGKKGKAQRIQVKVLKQRNDSKGEAPLYFYPMFNCFSETLMDHRGRFDNEGWQKSRSDY